MSTFANPAARAAVRERIGRLTPDAERAWGRMSPHQMICHLSDGYRMSAGKRASRPVDTLLSRSVMRFIALHTPMTWPKSVPTIEEADQERGGTHPVEWGQDCAGLLRLIDEFQAVARHPHPFFGPLTVDEWNVWAFRHADHHLRQFNV
jgi:hypothetical protein